MAAEKGPMIKRQDLQSRDASLANPANRPEASPDAAHPSLHPKSAFPVKAVDPTLGAIFGLRLTAFVAFILLETRDLDPGGRKTNASTVPPSSLPHVALPRAFYPGLEPCG